MDVTRQKGCVGYDYIFTTKDNKLMVSFKENDDISFRCKNDNNNSFLVVNITKSNEDIYNLFEQLYNDIIDCNICINNDAINQRIKTRDEYSCLVKGDIIYFKSDEPIDISAPEVKYNSMIISKNNENIELQFNFYDNKKNNSVTISSSNSRYAPFNIPFMRFYKNLQQYDPSYHQVTMNEYLYSKRKLLKKKKK